MRIKDYLRCENMTGGTVQGHSATTNKPFSTEASSAREESFQLSSGDFQKQPCKNEGLAR